MRRVHSGEALVRWLASTYWEEVPCVMCLCKFLAETLVTICGSVVKFTNPFEAHLTGAAKLAVVIPFP